MKDKPKLNLYINYKKFYEKTNEIKIEYGESDKREISWKDYLLFGGNLIGIICTILLIMLYIFLLFFVQPQKSGPELYYGVWVIGLLICICPFCWMMRTLYNPTICIDLDKIGILNLKHRQYSEENKLIEKYFPTFIEDLERHNLKQELKAEIWREEHPLEEKCRLAMMNNPNYVADLIREVTKYLK
jgi:hypothetical protein